MKLGLVLAGGGGKGAYQIGAWKALRELGIDKHVEVVAGTSIGALNSMLFMQGDLDAAEEAWLNISQDKILPLDKKDFVLNSKMLLFGTKERIDTLLKMKPELLERGAFSRDGILEILDRYVDFQKVMQSGMTCYSTCCNMHCRSAEYFKLNDYQEEAIKNIILASSAIPGIYDAIEVNCKLYLDGSLRDNIPIQPVYGEGCDVIIVVRFNSDEPLDRLQFPNCQIIDICSGMENNNVLKNGVLDFTAEGARRRMMKGYEDTMNLLHPIFTLFSCMASMDARKDAGTPLRKHALDAEGFAEAFRSMRDKLKDSIPIGKKKNTPM